ncbi:MAG: hypothetical protein AB1482_03460 [Pseudomonadota bacterium]
MIARKNWLFGVAALGLATAIPAHASPGSLVDSAWIVAKRDADREIRRDARDGRRDEYPGARRDDDARTSPDGYGYGYERRQQQRHENDERRRDRR